MATSTKSPFYFCSHRNKGPLDNPDFTQWSFDTFGRGRKHSKKEPTEPQSEKADCE